MLYPDGKIITDSVGNRYRYFADLNQWIDIGGVIQAQLVNYQQDGLVSPAIQDRVGWLAPTTDFKINGNLKVAVRTM